MKEQLISGGETMTYDIIQKIVKASGVTENELVLIHFWGEDTDKTIANSFIIAVASLGATPLFLQEARSINNYIFDSIPNERFGEKLFPILSKVDAVLDLFAYKPVVLGCHLAKEKEIRYRRYMAQLFSSLMKATRFTQIRLPTEENAIEAGLEATDFIHRINNAYNIDYLELKKSCERKKKELEQYHKLVLVSGDGCKLYFDLTGRKWKIDAGDGDWPCGEIYIAPVESETNGCVFFNTLHLMDVGAFSHVTLYIVAGMVAHTSDAELTHFFSNLSPENRVVCELGLGMNANISDLSGYVVLDEKMHDSFHIAVGSNNMFGGQNRASIHMDLVSDAPFFLQAAQ